jgi:hypothetical protein
MMYKKGSKKLSKKASKKRSKKASKKACKKASKKASRQDKINPIINVATINNVINNNDVDKMKEFIESGIKLSIQQINLIIDKHHVTTGYYKYYSYINDDDPKKIRNYLKNLNNSFIDGIVTDSDVIKIGSKDPELMAAIIKNKESCNFDLDSFVSIVPDYSNYCKNNIILEKMWDIIFFENVNFNYDFFENLIFTTLKKSINIFKYDEKISNLFRRKNDFIYNQKLLLLLIINKLTKSFEYLISEKNIKMNNLCFSAYLKFYTEKNTKNDNKIETETDSENDTETDSETDTENDTETDTDIKKKPKPKTKKFHKLVNENDNKTNENANLDEYYEKIFEGLQFTTKELNEAIRAQNNTIIKYLNKVKNIQLDDECFNNYLDINTCHSNEDYDDLFKNINLNIDHLEKAIVNNNHYIMTYLAIHRQIKLDRNLCELLIKEYSFTENLQNEDIEHNLKIIIDILDKNDVEINPLYLTISINNKNIGLIDYLVNTKNIKFNKECFNLLSNIFNVEYDWEKLLKLSENNLIFGSSDLEHAIRNQNIKVIKYLINEKKLKFDLDCFESLTVKFKQNINKKCNDPNIKNNITDNNIEETIELLDKNNNIQYDSSHLLIAIINTNIRFIEYLIKNKNINVNESCIIQYYANYYFYNMNEPIYNLLFDDIQFTQNCLEYACEKLDSKTVINILNQRSFIPNFKICLDKIINKKLSQCEPVNQILLTFYKFGNNLSEDDIIKLYNLGIKLDATLIKNYKPTSNFYDSCHNPTLCENACKDIYWLNKLCKSAEYSRLTQSKKAEIKKLINTYKLNPDFECISYIYKNKDLFDILTKNMTSNNNSNNFDNTDGNDAKDAKTKKKIVKKKVEKKKEIDDSEDEITETKTVKKKVVEKIVEKKKVETKDNPYC